MDQETAGLHCDISISVNISENISISSVSDINISISTVKRNIFHLLMLTLRLPVCTPGAS